MTQTKTLVVGGYTVKTAPGAVSLLDKFKGYWKFGIAAVGTLLIILNELTPMAGLVGISPHVVTVVIAIVTAISVFLKNNEHWVQDL